MFFKVWVEERKAYQHNKDNFPKPLTDISPEWCYHIGAFREHTLKILCHPQHDCTLFLPQEVKKPNSEFMLLEHFGHVSRFLSTTQTLDLFQMCQMRVLIIRQVMPESHCAIETFTRVIRRVLSHSTGTLARPIARRWWPSRRLSAESEGTDGAGICAAGLLVRTRHRLPCYYLPLRSEVSEWELPRPADAWRQTHRRRITEFAGAALLPEAGSQTYSWPDRGHAVSKTPSKAMIRKISLWLVRWEVQRRMFVVSRVVTTDYMCGLALSGFWQKLRPEAYLPTLETGLTTVT